MRDLRVPSSGLAEPSDADLAAAIAALWDDAQPRAIARVAVLEAAVAALAGGALDDATAAEATGEAHKLAGALGTFGMPEGTKRARAIEQRLAGGATPADADELAADVTALRAIVETGPASG
jgi:HPt (histidine-containing phosphotransfer) domain-containing protein